MALTNTLQPLRVPLPGSPRARRLGDSLVRARNDAPNLVVTIRTDQPFEAQIFEAAAAERLVEEDAEGITWWLHMPGAGRHNTEVVWDPARSQLSVGAWSGRAARQAGRGGSPGRLLWHASTWQPGVDGARATASVARGWVGVRLPKRRAAA